MIYSSKILLKWPLFFLDTLTYPKRNFWKLFEFFAMYILGLKNKRQIIWPWTASFSELYHIVSNIKSSIVTVTTKKEYFSWPQKGFVRMGRRQGVRFTSAREAGPWEPSSSQPICPNSNQPSAWDSFQYFSSVNLKTLWSMPWHGSPSSSQPICPSSISNEPSAWDSFRF